MSSLKSNQNNLRLRDPEFIDDDGGGRGGAAEGEGFAANKTWKPLATLTVANGFHTPLTFIVCFKDYNI